MVGKYSAICIVCMCLLSSICVCVCVFFFFLSAFLVLASVSYAGVFSQLSYNL